MEELVQQANCNLGMALVKLGLGKKGVGNFLQATKGPIRKIAIKAWYWLVKCYGQDGEFSKAREGLERLRSFGEDTMKEVEELEV